MKKILAFFMAFGLLMGTAYANDKLRMGTEGAYAPWNFINEDGDVAGFEIDLGNELCKRAGYDCEWVVNEWDTIIPNLVAGNYDTIIAGMSITDERKQSINFTQDYYPPDPSKFAVMAGAKIDFNNLKGQKIGVQGGTIQAAYVESNFAGNNTILSYETGDQSVADLAAGNVDVVLADGSFLKPIIDGSNGALKLDGPDILIGGGVGMGMRKGDNDLEMRMNKAIDSVKADGTLDALIKKYFDAGPFYAN